VRCDDRVQIITCHRTINSGARSRRRVTTRGNVGRIAQIAFRLSQLEDFLAVVNQLLDAMRIIKSDQIRQRAKAGVR